MPTFDKPDPAGLRRDAAGFRLRGEQVTRLEAFVDAAFAFAVTLLVISLDAIPDNIPALVEAMKGIPAFAASFAQIALFWYAHATWSKRYGLDDRAGVLLSLLLVFLVLVFCTPTSFVGALAVGVIMSVGGFLVLREHGGDDAH